MRAIAFRGVVLAAVVAAAAGCRAVKALEPLPAFDVAEAQRELAKMEETPERYRPVRAAKALSFLEEARLGKELSRGFAKLALAEPDMRSTHTARAVHENISMLEDACDGDAEKALEGLVGLESSQRNAFVWDRCKFERLGLISREEGVQSDLSATLLAHMAFAEVTAHGDVDPAERQLLLHVARMRPHVAPPADAE